MVKEEGKEGNKGELSQGQLMLWEAREVERHGRVRAEETAREVRDDPDDGVPPVSSKEKEKEKERKPEREGRRGWAGLAGPLPCWAPSVAQLGCCSFSIVLILFYFLFSVLLIDLFETICLVLG
jgi:hypothetical protein